MNVQDIYEAHKGDPTWVPGMLAVVGDFMQLEVAMRAAAERNPEIGPELVSRALQESVLKKGFPFICSALLASLCLDKAKASTTKP